MATTVQQDDIACRCLVDCRQHVVEANVVRNGIVIGVGLHFDATATEKRNVIGPGRFTRKNDRIRIGATNNTGRNAQRTGSARSLQCCNTATASRALAKHQLLNGGVECRVSTRPEV